MARLLVVLASLAYFTVRSAEFLEQPGYPSGYWYDLGVHIVATSYQAATIHSFHDFLDCMGWAAWGDVPEFAFNPMTTSAVLVSIVKLGASTQLAVKLLIVVQFWIAAISMMFLYRTSRRSWSWAIIAGLLYAFLPATALQVSSNLDLGFCVALAPLALAACVNLCRRVGLAALPLAGGICGVCGQGFAIEYLFVVTLPLYACITVLAYDARRRALWLVYSLLGSIVAVGIGLFCIIPTLASSAVVSSPASRIDDVESGSGFAIFGETVGALWHGVLTESTLTPWQEFNVSSLLWSTSIVLTCLWWAALFFGIRRFRRGGPTRSFSIVIAALVLVSFGTSIPFAATFWLAIARVPVLQFLRTPDRFVVVPLVVLIWWSIMMLESISRLRAGALRRLALPVVAISFISFSYFAFEAGALIVRPTLDYRLPALGQTNSGSRLLGGPLAAYTFVRGGSVLDTPLYGLGVPTRVIAQDLISRYGSGETHAIGMLRRAGIRTVVTTPVWALDGGLWPDLGAAFASSKLAEKAHGSMGGPIVWSISDPTPAVSVIKLACLHGGPGLLDEISTLPFSKNVAFLRGSIPCDLNLYANADPRDETTQEAIASWPAGLERGTVNVLDHDYPFVSTRVLLSRPWYRNAVDGDAPVFSNSAARISRDWYSFFAVRITKDGTYNLELRSAFDVDTCFVASVDGAQADRKCFPGGYGLHWREIPLKLASGDHVLSLRLALRGEAPTRNIILDGLLLVAANVDYLKHPHADTKPKLYVYSVHWATTSHGMRKLWLTDGNYHVAWYGLGRFRSGRIYVDGHLAGSRAHIPTGYHRISRPPPHADLVIFSEGLESVLKPQEPIATKASAASWNVTLRAPGVLRTTSLNDGSWFLDGESGHFAGYDCDLVNTCFGKAPAGKYILHHAWPHSILIGILGSTSSWAVAVLIFIIGFHRRPGKVRGSLGAPTQGKA